MRFALALMLASLSLLGCDRLLADDDPPPVAVAPIAPPMVVVRTNAPSVLALFVDGQPAGPLTDGRRVQLEVGRHAFEARRDSEVVARAEQTLVAGDQVEVTLNVPEPPTPPPTVTEDTSGPRRAEVTLGRVVSESGSDALAGAVRSSFRARVRAMRACYERVLEEEPGLSASVHVRFTVQPAGAVRDVETEDSASAALERCVADIVRRFRFVPPGVPEPSRYAISVTFVPPVTTAEPAPAHRQTPTRSDVVAAMREVSPAVQACSGGRSGMATVRFTFRGADGAVESATVSGSLPANVRSCVEGAAGRARLSPFHDETFSVSYPFRL